MKSFIVALFVGALLLVLTGCQTQSQSSQPDSVKRVALVGPYEYISIADRNEGAFGQDTTSHDRMILDHQNKKVIPLAAYTNGGPGPVNSLLNGASGAVLNGVAGAALLDDNNNGWGRINLNNSASANANANTVP